MGFLKNLFSSSSDEKENDSQNEDKEKEKNFDILKFDGLRAAQIGKTDYAIRCFKEALLLKDDYETMSYLANSYIYQNDLKDAREVLENMCQIEPTNIDTYIRLANVCYQSDDYSAMVSILEKAHEIDDKNATIQYLFAKANKGLKNDINVIATLTQAIKLKEDFLDARLMRAEALLDMGCLKEAEEDIRICMMQATDNEEVLLIYAKIMQASDRMEEAEKSYQKVIQLNPFNEKAYLDVCRLYQSQKELGKTLATLDEAIEVNPDFADAYKMRGEVKLLKGDKEGSTEDLKKALELNPEEEKNLTGEYHNYDDLKKNSPF